MPGIGKEFIFLQIPFLSLDSIKKPLHVDLTSKNNSILSKLLSISCDHNPHILKSYFLSTLSHIICLNYIVFVQTLYYSKILSKSQITFISQDIMLKASTYSKTRRKTCPRHIVCLEHAILLSCSTGKCLFKVNDRCLFKK